MNCHECDAKGDITSCHTLHGTGEVPKFSRKFQHYWRVYENRQGWSAFLQGDLCWECFRKMVNDEN